MNYLQNHGRTEGIYFKSITFNEMPEFHNMGFRPYTSNPNTMEVCDSIASRLQERYYKAGKFNPSTVTDLTDNMIGVTGSSTGQISIVNGWQTKRYSFSMYVEVRMTSGGSIVYIVSGFTDTNEIHINGNQVFINPDIVLHITNINTGTIQMNQDNSTGILIMSSDQVLSKNQYLQDWSVQGNEFRSQRPLDVFNTITSNMFKQDTDAIFINASTSLPQPVLANRVNNIPTNYTTKLLNSYLEATEVNKHFEEEHYFPNPGELSNTNAAKENYLHDNKFLSYLGRNDITSFNVVSFKWKDILNINPHVMDIVHVNTCHDRINLFNQSGFSLPSNALITSSVSNRSDLIGQIVATLQSSIPALVNRCQLRNIIFAANNNMGSHVVNVINASSFNPFNVQNGVQLFENLLPDQILSSLFTHIQLSYELFVFCQIETETFIRISINGGAYEDFLLPTYADALLTPLITNDYNTIDTISNTVNMVSNTIAQSNDHFDYQNSIIKKEVKQSKQNNTSFINPMSGLNY